MMKWQFPSANNTGSHGLKGFQEDFNDNPMYSLAKEICQNSLDAVDDPSKPVIVDFSLFYLDRSKFPDRDNYLEIIERCIDYNKKYFAKKEYTDFYLNARRCLKATDMAIMKISDYNTHGLLGSDNEDNSDWYNLVKAEGVSDKGDGKGGSFGHGKFATYACSELQTVFYSTNAKDGKKAHQGVSRLSTYRDANNEKTLGIGFCGEPNCNNVSGMLTFPNEYEHRKDNEYGTDIYIMAFDETIDDYDYKIIAAVIDSFYVAINDEKLVFRYGDDIINKETIKNYIDNELYREYMSEDTPLAYEALISENEEMTFKGSIVEENDVLLKLIIKEDKTPNHIAMIRMNGMKILDRNKLPKNPFFGGCLMIKSVATDSYFRSLENPQHNNWSVQRAKGKEKQEEAKERIAKIGKFIKDTLSAYLMNNQQTAIEVEGLEEFLPDDIPEEIMNSQKKAKSQLQDQAKEDNKNKREKIDLRNNEHSLNKTNTETEEIINIYKEQDNEELVNLIKPENDERHRVNPLPPDGESNTFTKFNKTVKAKFTRCLFTNETYVLLFETTDKYSQLRIDVAISGETINSPDLNILDAKIDSTLFNRKKVTVEGNKMIVTNINEDEKIRITFKVDTDETWPIEVRYYASK